MILRKGIRRDVLFLLASLIDFHRRYSYSTIVSRISCLGYEPPSVRRQLYRMTLIGDLEKVVKKGKPCLRLTSAGQRKIKENISLFSWQGKRWDGWWRMIIFDISEERRHVRNWLRQKLERLGFGQWQKSVYVSPHDLMDEVNRYLEVKKLTSEVACLMARQGNRKKDKKLAYRAWNLEELEDEYWDFIHNWQEGSGGKEIELWAQYQTLVEKDPFLPKELLPDRWPGFKAYLVFKKTLKQLWPKKYSKD